MNLTVRLFWEMNPSYHPLLNTEGSFGLISPHKDVQEWKGNWVKEFSGSLLYTSGGSALHFSVLSNVEVSIHPSIHPLRPFLPLYHLVSLRPSFLQAAAPMLSSIIQSSFYPAAVSSSSFSHLFHSLLNHVSFPLATSHSIHPPLFFFHLHPLSINQPLCAWTGTEDSLCSPPLTHTHPPLTLIFIS